MSAETDPVPGRQNVAMERTDEPLGGLIARVAGGDESALAMLYDRTCAQVHGLVTRILKDETGADEVTADVYRQIWRRSARFEPERGRPLAWLLMVARSRAIDRLRAGATERARTEPLPAALTVPCGAPTPEESCAIDDRRRIVQGALARLAPEQRQAIELAYFGGLSQSEIAARLEEPLGTIKTRIRTGMMRLRDALGATGRAVL